MRISHVARYYYGQGRSRFSLDEDRCAGWSMLAVESGRFAYGLGEESTAERTAQSGEIVFCPPGQLLKRKVMEPLSFHFAEFTTADNASLPELIRIKDVERLGSTFRYLKEWQEEQGVDRNLYQVRHYIEDLIIQVNREREKAERSHSGRRDSLMSQAAALIQQHAFEQEFSLQELARSLGIGASQLTRRFQAAYGMSPARYATQARLMRARLLLAESHDTLDTIAEQCGYQNAFYFSRVFTKHMHISPTAYRKTFRV